MPSNLGSTILKLAFNHQEASKHVEITITHDENNSSIKISTKKIILLEHLIPQLPVKPDYEFFFFPIYIKLNVFFFTTRYPAKPKI